MQQQQQQEQPPQTSVASNTVVGSEQIQSSELTVGAPPPGFIPLPEGMPVPAPAIPTTSVGPVDTSQPPPLRPPEMNQPPGLPGLPAGMPGGMPTGPITGVPPPGAMPMVSPFALPNVPRKWCL